MSTVSFLAQLDSGILCYRMLFCFVILTFMIIFYRISQIFNIQFNVLNQVHWLSYIEMFWLKFTCYWQGQEIIKNTESYNQGDNEFKINNKFKQWLCFHWRFIIVMDSIINFFHYKKWIIHWHKKLFKNTLALYSFNPSSSVDIFKFMLQGFWEIQQYFVFEAVFTRNLKIKKMWDFLNIRHQVSNTFFPTRGYYSQIQTITGTMCVKYFRIHSEYMHW